MVLLIRGNIEPALGRIDYLPDGNSAVPGLSFATDNDTGLYHPSPDTVGISTNATSRLVINDTSITANVSLVPTGNGVLNVGSLTNRWNDLYLSGNTIYLGNAVVSETNGNVVIGNLDVTHISGDGSSVTSLNASQLSTGTVPDARVSGAYTGFTDLTASGTVSAGNIDANLNASQLTSGTIPDDRVSGAYTGFTDLTASGTVSAGNIDANLNASQLTSGTIPDDRVSGAYTGFTDLTASGTVSTGNVSVTNDAIVHGHTVGRGGGANGTNVAIGSGALLQNTTGYNNSAIGVNALYATTTGNNNSAMGVNALRDNIDGVGNNAFGVSALEQNTSGVYNTAIGHQAMVLNTTGNNNSALGLGALYSNSTGNNNSALGQGALYSNSTGTLNTACGSQSLLSNTTGSLNTATGVYALYYNTTGSNNTATGVNSMTNNVTGFNNTSIGYQSLYYNTSGSQNTASGLQALHHNTTGFNNTASGLNALFANTTGSQNTASGFQALFANTTGSFNTAIGLEALLYTTGGAGANYTNTTGLGYNTRCSGNNQVQLGDASTTTYAFGAVQNRSDQRDKTDVEDEVLGLAFLDALRPVTFRWDYRDDYFKRVIVAALDTPSVDIPDGEYPVVSSDGMTHIATATVADGTVTLSNHTEFASVSDVPPSATIDTVAKVSLRADTILKPIPKDGSKKRTRKHHGLIAQELVQTLVDKNIDDFAGLQHHSKAGGEDVYSIGYTEFVAPLIKAVQELKSLNDTTTQELNDIKARLAALENGS